MSREPGGEPEEKRYEKNRKLGLYMRYSGVGIQFLVSILLCLWLGSLVDGWTGLSPVFLVLGAFLGFAAGTWALYKVLFGRKK